jgi:UDPglucose--hexose-1-phosphate uridylyltransferase
MELRKDYILERWVFLASERKKRPREFKYREKKETKQICYFCPGNEHLTPPEIGRIKDDNNKWKIRWFPNKFPVVEQKGDFLIKTDNTYFTFSNAYGKHEVIAETPHHEKQMWDLSREQIKEILDVYKQRITKLSELEHIKYVLVFKNHGREGGTSLVHSHTQVAAINIVPTLVKEEVEACKKYEKCPYCEIINIEKGSYRRCFENDSIVAFTPYASRFNFEIWMFPKRHVKNITELNNNEMIDLAEILKNILIKLKKLNAAYNFFLHYAPKGEDLHFHIEVTPRFAVWAGFEFSSNAIINSVTPEDAAKFYRGEIK